MAALAESPETLLAALADSKLCGTALSNRVYTMLVQPFRESPSSTVGSSSLKPAATMTKRATTKTKTKVSADGDQKKLTTQLAPLAMRIVNQNLQTISRLLMSRDSKAGSTGIASDGDMQVVMQCLADTSLYAVTGLQYMEPYLTIKSLDIEKALSNVITKIIEIGMYERALQELSGLRSRLASFARLSPASSVENVPEEKKSVGAGNASTTKVSVKASKSTAKSSTTTTTTISKTTISKTAVPAPSKSRQSSKNKEATSLTREQTANVNTSMSICDPYKPLFCFPLEADITDQAPLLLIMACQANALRCWVELKKGALIKYLPFLLDQPGNPYDWCLRLRGTDKNVAAKQFDIFYRAINKAATIVQALNDDGPLQALYLRTRALLYAMESGAHNASTICEQVMKTCAMFERSCRKVSMEAIPGHLLQSCSNIMIRIVPNIEDAEECAKLFALCEYVAHIARKANDFDTGIEALASFSRQIEIPRKELGKLASFQTLLQECVAEVSIALLVLDRILLGGRGTDDTTRVERAAMNMHLLIKTMKINGKAPDSVFFATTAKLLKGIDLLRRSCANIFDHLEKKLGVQAKQGKQDAFATPKAPSKRTKPEVDDPSWLDVSAVVTELLGLSVDFVELFLKRYHNQYQYHYIQTSKDVSQVDSQTASYITTQKISLVAVDILMLLSRMAFDIDDESTQSEAEAYLTRADRVCQLTGSSDGWRWVSSAYHNIGGALYKQGLFERAIGSLLKSCELLAECLDHWDAKSSAGGLNDDLDELRSQLCKRYEVLGISFQKTGEVESAKQSLTRAIISLPMKKLENFATYLDQESLVMVVQRIPTLPKLIDRYLRLLITDSSMQDDTKFTHVILANCDLPAAGMGGIMEYELSVLKSLSQKFDLGGNQMDIVDGLLEIYDAQLYPIRRARVLLEKVKLVRSSSKFIEKDSEFSLLLAKKAVELLKTESYKKDSKLLELRKCYLANAYSWIGVCCHESCRPSSKPFKMALQLWKIVLKRIPPICSGGQPSNEVIASTRAEVDDVERLYGHLHMLADFFGVVDQPINQILALRLMLRLNNGLRDTWEEGQAGWLNSVGLYTNIGHLYVGLGYTGKAGLAFSQARLLLEDPSCPDETRLEWMLGYSHYLCFIGNFDKSEQTFNGTKEIADARISNNNGKTPSKLSQKRVQENILLAHASFTRSELALRMGFLDKAIEDATKSLRLLKRVTSSLMRRTKHIWDQPEKLANPFLVESGQVTDDVVLADKENQSTVKTVAELAMQQSQWDITKRLLTCFGQLGNLYIIRGSAREAEYFFNQGLALAQSINASAVASKFLIFLTELEYRRHRWEESEMKLKQATDCQGEEELFARNQADLKMRAGDLNFRQESYDQALCFYEDAAGILTAMMDQTFILSLENLQPSEDQTPRERRLANTPPGTPTLPRKSDDGIEFECYVLDYMRSELFCRKGWLLSKQGKLGEARELLNRLDAIRPKRSDGIEYHLTFAKITMLSVFEQLSQNSAFGMIQDSVLLLPQQGMLSTDKHTKSSKKGGQKNLPELQRDTEAALQHLTDAYSMGFDSATPQQIYEICMYLASTHIIKSYCVDLGKLDSSRVARTCAYYLEMSKGVSIRREMLSCLEEKLRTRKSRDDLVWPKGFSYDDANSENSWSSESSLEITPEWHRSHLNDLLESYSREGSADEAAFQKEFIDILPPYWTVCSVSIDIENEDMYIVRMRASEVPTVLRLPLKRQAMREGDEQGFGYTDALEEFNTILESSNQTTEMGKNCESRDEKLSWWKKRKELDDRMKELLERIQSTWLGGFKGALSADFVINERALRKFKSTIESLAFKAVSSKASTKSKVLELDWEICKIFVQLGISSNVNDLEDLVYFLLDAYQYNGVAIAYDEIDIDQITEDLKDALANYYESASNNLTNNVVHESQHVILILDKNSQMLPWESLPVLRHQPVSRLPSLSFLRDRILFAKAAHAAVSEKEAHSTNDWQDYRIDQHKTSYVLNPSQDLKSTQVEFESYLDRFEDWEGVIGRAPSDMECEKALKNQDLYIYFGHSGGEQYIRGYQVRQLDRCAVTLLMGCSSGCLKPAGEFDPYGNALNYIMAGCPALVANLWDVTDKDIDRFSKALFHRWGLEPEDIDTDSNPSNMREDVSLVEAVTFSRDECHLKYLIGAAPVVYGIPVYLS